MEEGTNATSHVSLVHHKYLQHHWKIQQAKPPVMSGLCYYYIVHPGPDFNY